MLELKSIHVQPLCSGPRHNRRLRRSTNKLSLVIFSSLSHDGVPVGELKLSTIAKNCNNIKFHLKNVKQLAVL